MSEPMKGAILELMTSACVCAFSVLMKGKVDEDSVVLTSVTIEEERGVYSLGRWLLQVHNGAAPHTEEFSGRRQSLRFASRCTQLFTASCRLRVSRDVNPMPYVNLEPEAVNPHPSCSSEKSRCCASY